MLGACNFYMPIFEEALEAYGLPLELKYLPVIESALNPKAVSRVGATGLWQFMLVTGKQYGLEVNSLVDERRDPVKASYAAAHYLSDLYKIFGDWSLVIASYNCGPGNINKAIHRAGGAKDYWQIYPYLPRETRGYVPAFIAANYVMTYYSAHNICALRTKLPLKTDTVVVNRNVHLQQIASVLGIDIDMLRTLNPEYRRDIVPGLTKPSAIKLALNDVTRFIDNQDSIYNYNASELLSKRAEVAVPDDLPTFTSYKKTKKSRKATVRKGRKSKTTKKTTASKGRKTTATKSRKTAAKPKAKAKAKPKAKKTTARKKRR
jgi:membrane-bound lytic murein transglycosylase D